MTGIEVEEETPNFEAKMLRVKVGAKEGLKIERMELLPIWRGIPSAAADDDDKLMKLNTVAIIILSIFRQPKIIAKLAMAMGLWLFLM